MGLRYGSRGNAQGANKMAQTLIFWVATASVCMGMGALFAVLVTKQQIADDDTD